MSLNINIKDFYLNYETQWSVDTAGMQKENGELVLEYEHIIDHAAGRRYANKPLKELRWRCLSLSLTTPFLYTPIALLNIANRVVKLVTLSHFWMPTNEDRYDFASRYKAAAEETLHLIFSAIGIVALPLAALHGAFFNPLNGRKLYATFERAAFGGGVVAKDFQPVSGEKLEFIGDLIEIDESDPGDFLTLYEQKDFWHKNIFLNEGERRFYIRLHLIQQLYGTVVGCGLDNYFNEVFHHSVKRQSDKETQTYVEELRRKGVVPTEDGCYQLIGFN